MATINPRVFKGYTSKADLVLDNDEFLAELHNCIINKGDICNVPGIVKDSGGGTGGSTTWPLDIRTGALYHTVLEMKEGEEYVKKEINVVSVFNADKSLPLGGATSSPWILYELPEYFDPPIEDGIPVNRIDYVKPLLLEEQAEWQRRGFNLKFKYKDSIYTGGSSNFVQVGEWLLCLGQFFDLADDAHLARMVKVRYNTSHLTRERIVIQSQFIGVHGPKKVTFVESSGNPALRNLDVAFTFVDVATRYQWVTHDGEGDPLVTPYYDWWIDQKGTLGEDDIESNATRYGTDKSTFCTYDIYYPENFIKISLSGNYRIGVYVKEGHSSDFVFFEYYDPRETTPGSDEDGIFIRYALTAAIDDNLNDGANLDSTRTAPFTDIVPIVGSHDIPKSAWHGCYFQGRMYYASIEDNYVQFSQFPPDDDPNIGRYLNYIEGQFPVGSTSNKLSGLVEFMGQLVIFKYNRTYILTKDIDSGGELREMFSDLGCVNIYGGRAYLEVNNVLYFMDKTGLHEFTGAGIPVKVSELIQEDLDDIDEKRFSFCRLASDLRYNLIYVTFPAGYLGDRNVQKSFIYNFVEKTWTTFSGPVEKQVLQIIPEKIQLNAKSNIVLFENVLARMGTLEEENPIYLLPLLMKTGLITLKAQGRYKHWKMFRLEKFKEFNDDYPGIHLKVIDEEGNVYIDDDIIKAEKHLGLHTKGISLEISSITAIDPLLNITNPYRINGYTLNAHIRGRR